MSEAEPIFTKAAWRLIPLLCVLYLVNFLDRVNVGFAALTMNRDIGLSPAAYGLGAGMFFIGYVLCEVPANLALERIGARRWFFCIMLSWGFLSTATALARGPASFYALRFLLGICEAGFFPGVMLYLSYWFPQSSRARFNALFLLAVPLANVIGAPVSGAILALDGFGRLQGWQWLFLIEGIPSALLAFAVLFLLPEKPETAHWLTREEKNIMTAALARGAPQPGSLWSALSDVRILIVACVYFGLVLGTYGLGLWLPQIVAQMGYGHLVTGLIVALPNALSFFAMIFWAKSSDARGERCGHVALAALFGAAGLVLAAISNEDAIRIAGLCVATMGIYAGVTTIWTLPSAFLGGTAAAAGIALINSIGNLGGFAGPYLMGWFKQSTGGYGEGLAVLAAGLVATAVLVLLLARSFPNAVIPANARTQRSRVRG